MLRFKNKWNAIAFKNRLVALETIACIFNLYVKFAFILFFVLVFIVHTFVFGIRPHNFFQLRFSPKSHRFLFLNIVFSAPYILLLLYNSFSNNILDRNVNSMFGFQRRTEERMKEEKKYARIQANKWIKG